MKLTKQEQEILDGKQGLVKQQAMKTLVAYGEGLGADRLIDVDDVTTCVNCPYPNDFLAGIE